MDILDEAVCIPQCAKMFGKGMNLTILKIVGQAVLILLGRVTGIGEGKLN